MTQALSRFYKMALSEEDTDWNYVASVETKAHATPVHENMLRAEALLAFADAMTKTAEQLLKGHLNS